MTNINKRRLEAVYQQYLINKSLRLLDEDSSKGRFDTQGHWITEITLEEADYAAILDYEKIDWNGLIAKKHFCDLLEIAPTETTYCNLDITPNVVHSIYLNRWLLQNLHPDVDNVDDITILEKVVPHVWGDGRASIIGLQEEMEMHRRLIFRVFSDALKKSGKELNSTITKAIHDSLAKQVNVQVLHAFQKALVDSYLKDEDPPIDFAELNVKLDEAREELNEGVHQQVIRAIVMHGGAAGFSGEELLAERDKESSKLKSLGEHDFESTTATGNDYLRTDTRNGMVVRITATNVTAHDKKEGEHLAHRRLFRHAYGTVLGGESIKVGLVDDSSLIFRDVIMIGETRCEVRVPSIAVVKKKDCPNPVPDVALKLGILHESLSDPAEEEVESKETAPDIFIYNLLTSLPFPGRDGLDSHQRQSAEYILKGAHQYNRDQLEKNPGRCVFIQNIPVNQHTLALASDSYSEVVKEACLMAELSLIHTLSELMPGVTALATLYITAKAAYDDFLNGLPENTEPTWFYASTHGKVLRDAITTYRDAPDPTDPTEPASGSDPFQNLVARALHKIFLDGDYKNKQFGMLIQALSVFSEKKSVAGCKSANERYAAVAGRVELLYGIMNATWRPQSPLLNEFETALLNTLVSYINGDSASASTLVDLQTALDRAFNAYNLQGSANAISEEDQGAGPKTKKTKDNSAKRGTISEINTNIIEPATLDRLSQKHTKDLQSHHAKHAAKLRDALTNITKEFPIGVEKIDDDDLWCAVSATIAKRSAEDVGIRKRGFEKIRKPDDVELDASKKLYHLMMEQEVLYDDDKGVYSYFQSYIQKDQGDEKKIIYVRDARELGTADEMTSERARELYESKAKQQEEKKSRQWLIMGVNYTLALATLLKTQGVVFEDGGDWLYTMAENFIANADSCEGIVTPVPYEKKKPKKAEKNYQAHFLNYVRYVLGEKVLQYLPSLVKDGSLESALKLLDKTKDWVAMEEPTFYVATVSQLTKGDALEKKVATKTRRSSTTARGNRNSSVATGARRKSSILGGTDLTFGQEISSGVVMQLEEPVTKLHRDQIALLQSYETSDWFKELADHEKELFRYFYEIQKADGNRVLPSQLRDRLGVGLRNGYGNRVLLLRDFGLQNIFKHAHSGCLPIVLKKARKIQKEIKTLDKIQKEVRTANNTETLERLKKELRAFEGLMLQSAKGNIEQQLQYAKDVTGNPHVKTLSLVLNTRSMAEFASSHLSVRDPTDSLITQYSEEATREIDDAIFVRPGVAWGMFEPSDVKSAKEICGEVKTLIEKLEALGIDSSRYKQLKDLNDELNGGKGLLKSYGQGSAPFFGRSHRGIFIASSLMRLIEVRNQVRTYLLQSNDDAFQRVGRGIDEIYTFIRCASGDNRTQDGSLYSQISTLAEITRLSLLQVTVLLAFNGHVHIMAGSQGGSCGTVGIRGQSIDAMPLNTSEELGMISKKVLCGPEADQKSVVPGTGIPDKSLLTPNEQDLLAAIQAGISPELTDYSSQLIEKRILEKKQKEAQKKQQEEALRSIEEESKTVEEKSQLVLEKKSTKRPDVGGESTKRPNGKKKVQFTLPPEDEIQSSPKLEKRPDTPIQISQQEEGTKPDTPYNPVSLRRESGTLDEVKDKGGDKTQSTPEETSSATPILPGNIEIDDIQSDAIKATIKSISDKYDITITSTDSLEMDKSPTTRSPSTVGETPQSDNKKVTYILQPQPKPAVSKEPSMMDIFKKSTPETVPSPVTVEATNVTSSVTSSPETTGEKVLSKPTQRIDRVSTTHPEETSLKLMASMIQKEFNDPAQSLNTDYFVIEGEDIVAKIELAIQCIQTGGYKPRQVASQSRVRWPTLIRDIQDLDQDNRKKLKECLSKSRVSMEGAGNDEFATLKRQCLDIMKKHKATPTSQLGLFRPTRVGSGGTMSSLKDRFVPTMFAAAILIDLVDLAEKLFGIL